MNRLASLLTAAFLGCAIPQAVASPTPLDKAPSRASTVPRPASSAREPVTVARNAPAIIQLIKQAKSEGNADAPADPKVPTVDETVTQIPLGGQCGFAGCSSSTLVAFTYRTRGANTATRTVLAMVSCEAVAKIPCTAVPAEVRATGGANPTQ